MNVTVEKNHVIGLIISVVLCLIISLIYALKVFNRLEVSTFDIFFKFRGYSGSAKIEGEGIQGHARAFSRKSDRMRDDIIIIGIDEETVRDFSDNGILWPFPWNKHALLTDYLSSGKPLMLFFDIMFLEKKPYEDELAKAIRKAGNVFINYQFETVGIESAYKDQEERIALLNRIRWKADPTRMLEMSEEEVEEAVPPRSPLIRAAKGIGFANVFPDKEDNVNRKMPLILQFHGWYYPNIDLIMAMYYYGIGPENVEIKIGEYIKLKNLRRERMSKKNKNNEIVIPIDSRGLMDINFVGGQGSFQNYSYSYFCKEGSMGDNDSLKNKIIMVGAYLLTGVATDTQQSPYGQTFGIEHHANALNTILNQDFIYRLSTFQNILILLLIAILLGLTVSRLSILTSSLFTMGLFILFVVISILLFVSGSIAIATATPGIQIVLSFTVIITYRVLTEQKEKKHIRQTFSKLVAKSVVDELLKYPDKLKLGGDKKILSVLFSDIRGFTTLSEGTTPEKLVEHLNEYLQAMTEVVLKYNGTLDKYIGDAIMAFWGAPIPLDTHALLACKAAIEMTKELERLNATWVIQKKEELHIRIGINTGDMLVGLMGSSSRMDYTLIGDNVNLGSRLEGTNKMYKTVIIISEFTYEHVKDFVIVRELDLIRVKGKARPVKIYELIDIKEGNL